MGRSQTQQFRFLHHEVAEMEKLWKDTEGNPPRSAVRELEIKFGKGPELGGRNIQVKQVQNWFCNKRHYRRKRARKASRQVLAEEHSIKRTESVSVSPTLPDVKEQSKVEFEAKSARDGAWYDVRSFLAHRMLDSGDPEVRVRFVGFGADEDEWVNVRRGVRPRSLPCEASECVRVIPGDVVLCFKEGTEQALYYDACVVEVERRRHDIRGCRCRFLIRYDHDGSTDVVPLRKVCRRPETEFRALPSRSAANISTTERKVPDVAIY